jgi:polyisoprenyl-phosphate glycosyltransferase
MVEQPTVSASDIKISVVIPIYNEDQIISELHSRLHKVVSAFSDFEIIFVNDGSTDHTLEQLVELHEKDSRYKIIDLARNFGHQVAITAGMQYADGDAVVVMDSDLQDPPETIINLFEKFSEGYEVVYAIRRKRKEGILKRLAYSLYYRMLLKASNIHIPRDSGDFCMMSRRACETLRSLPETNRFVRGLRSWIGFKQTGFEYERDRRYAGDVKYSFTHLVRLGMDGLISFSYLPLRMVSYFGFIISFFSMIGILIVVYLKLGTNIPVKGIPALAVMILFLGGVQLTMLGLLGEYLGRIYDEVKRRPIYTVQRVYGIDEG